MLILEEMLAEVVNVWLSIFLFWGKLEDRTIVLATHLLVDLVDCDLEHLDLIDHVEHVVLLFRRLPLLDLSEDLLSDAACCAHNRANPGCGPEIRLACSHGRQRRCA